MHLYCFLVAQLMFSVIPALLCWPEYLCCDIPVRSGQKGWKYQLATSHTPTGLQGPMPAYQTPVLATVSDGEQQPVELPRCCSYKGGNMGVESGMGTIGSYFQHFDEISQYFLLPTLPPSLGKTAQILIFEPQ